MPKLFPFPECCYELRRVGKKPSTTQIRLEVVKVGSISLYVRFGPLDINSCTDQTMAQKISVNQKGTAKVHLGEASILSFGTPTSSPRVLESPTASPRVLESPTASPRASQSRNRRGVPLVKRENKTVTSEGAKPRILISIQEWACLAC